MLIKLLDKQLLLIIFTVQKSIIALLIFLIFPYHNPSVNQILFQIFHHDHVFQKRIRKLR